jgi:transposase InsO family protein
MAERREPTIHERWAHLRFSVVGPLLSSPPGRGELCARIETLSEQSWRHPVTGEPTRFGTSTIERWYYQARRAQLDPVGALRKKVRKDAGQRPAMGETLKAALLRQHAEHPGWSYQLHHDNLRVLAQREPEALGPPPSYATVRRFMQATGLFKRARAGKKDTEGVRRAARRLEEREVRSFEVAYVNGLWHLDFHVGSMPVLTTSGGWEYPHLCGVLDDRSRLGCHAQWYLTESAETLVHALSQAIAKRGLPRELMSDNGPAEIASEVTEGLLRLGIVHSPTLEHSPYQNGKQESFWGQVEGRLLAMLENKKDLTLALLNEATLAWLELEYNRAVHSETGESPLRRYLSGPDVARPSPTSEELRLAFTASQLRTQRRSDGTLSLEGRRFEIPSRYRHLERIAVRFARWDLGQVWMEDPRTSKVLCRLFPLDRSRNAQGVRRTLEPIAVFERPQAQPDRPVIAPLLEKLLADYRSSGLPPAYLPMAERAEPEPHEGDAS